jgi:hypothetical protein
VAHEGGVGAGAPYARARCTAAFYYVLCVMSGDLTDRPPSSFFSGSTASGPKNISVGSTQPIHLFRNVASPKSGKQESLRIPLLRSSPPRLCAKSPSTVKDASWLWPLPSLKKLEEGPMLGRRNVSACRTVGVGLNNGLISLARRINHRSLHPSASSCLAAPVRSWRSSPLN